MSTKTRGRFVEAGVFWRWFLNRYELAGIVMPINMTCYYLPPWHRSFAFMRHEGVHFDQIERDGRWTFMAKYLWWNCTRGYRQNPYELEAYGIGATPVVEEEADGQRAA